MSSGQFIFLRKAVELNRPKTTISIDRNRAGNLGIDMREIGRSLSTFGAMVFLTLGFASVNIYTQVGLITLIGLIAKNGILIVEFANQLRIHEGLGKREAVERASRIRLRPILMTTVSMVVAMVPLLIATGPGAVSRFHIGLVIAAGLGISTLFTLYVVPAFYMLLSPKESHSMAQAVGT